MKITVRRTPSTGTNVARNGIMRKARFLVVGVMWLALASAWSDVPKTISYQGILKKADGTAMVPDGGYNIVFSIYTLASGGTLKYRETQAVQVKNGFYAVVIGTGTPRAESPVASLSLLSFNDEYWLGITVGADPTVANTELTPRVRLTASPYALNADTVDSLHAADLLDKAIYDINKDGIVDVAAVAKGVDFASGVNLQLNNGFVATGAGTVGNPGFTFTGDLNTGIFAPAADTLGFSTGGTSRLTLSSTGVNAGSSAITTTGTLSTGAATVTSLNAGSGAITTTGTLSTGAATVTSLGAGSGAITTTGTLSAGPATVTSLAAGSGAITTTGTLSAGAAALASLNTGMGAYELYAMDQNVRTFDPVTFGKIVGPAGSMATPTYTFTSDLHTGIYSTAGAISFSGNSERILTLAETGASDNYAWVNGNLSVSRPTDTSFVPPTIRLAIGDSDTGLDWASDGILTLVTNNVERARIGTDTFNISTDVGIGIGTAAVGSLLRLAIGKADTGLNCATDGALTFFVNNIERARLTNNEGMFILAMGKGFQVGGGSWGTVSDERLKKNIAGLSGSLDALLKLRGVTFEWKDPEKMGNQAGTQTGFIAQEVETVFPKWVETTPDGFKGLCLPVGFSALTVEAIRELAAKNAALEADLAATKATLADVLKRLTALEAAK